MIYPAEISQFLDKEAEGQTDRDTKRFAIISAQTFYFPLKGLYHFPAPAVSLRQLMVSLV